jgi:hypothetical protein
MWQGNTLTLDFPFRFYNEDNKILEQRFGKGIPDVFELASQTSLMLVNQHFSLSGPRPLTPQVIEVGGLHIKETKPLPEVTGKTLIFFLNHSFLLLFRTLKIF